MMKDKEKRKDKFEPRRNSYESRNSPCKHKRLRYSYPFGKNSTPRISCRKCGRPIKPYELKEIRKKSVR